MKSRNNDRKTQRKREGRGRKGLEGHAEKVRFAQGPPWLQSDIFQVAIDPATSLLHGCKSRVLSPVSGRVLPSLGIGSVFLLSLGEALRPLTL